MTRSVAVDLAAGRVVDRSRAPGWTGSEPGEITHGRDLTPAHVGIAGAGLTTGDLTETSGTVSSSQDGETIDGLNVDTGRIVIEHDNVTVQNCRVAATGDYGIVVDPGVVGASIEFCEVWGSDSAGLLLNGACDVYRTRVEDAVDSIKVGSDQTLTECYVSTHNGANPDAPGAHLDCVQSVGGSNVTLVRCYLRLNDVPDAGSPNGCIQWGANFGPISGYTAEDCYFWGWPNANYAFRVGSKDGVADPSNIAVTGCIWEDGAWTSGPVNLPASKSGWTWEDNFTTTGTPVTI